MVEQLKQLVRDQLALMQAAAQVLEESRARVAAHDYLIESADRVLAESLVAAPELLDTVSRILCYVRDKGYA